VAPQEGFFSKLLGWLVGNTIVFDDYSSAHEYKGKEPKYARRDGALIRSGCTSYPENKTSPSDFCIYDEKNRDIIQQIVGLSKELYTNQREIIQDKDLEQLYQEADQRLEEVKLLLNGLQEQIKNINERLKNEHGVRSDLPGNSRSRSRQENFIASMSTAGRKKRVL